MKLYTLYFSNLSFSNPPPTHPPTHVHKFLRVPNFAQRTRQKKRHKLLEFTFYECTPEIHSQIYISWYKLQTPLLKSFFTFTATKIWLSSFFPSSATRSIHHPFDKIQSFFHLCCCCCCRSLGDQLPPITLPRTTDTSISWCWLQSFLLLAETLFVVLFSSCPPSRIVSPFRVMCADPCSSRKLWLLLVLLLLPMARPTKWPAATVGWDCVLPVRGGEKQRGKYSSLSHANREFRKCSSRATRPCLCKKWHPSSGGPKKRVWGLWFSHKKGKKKKQRWITKEQG